MWLERRRTVFWKSRTINYVQRRRHSITDGGAVASSALDNSVPSSGAYPCHNDRASISLTG